MAADTHPSAPPLTVLLAAPRGFCAGVDRAIQIVERALEKFGPPVYVRHEIVHNRTVVEGLEAKGAIFVEELHEVPADAPVIFSAHGVPKSVPADAERRNMLYVDATCPLVSKVHREAERHHASGAHILLIGHAGHPEVVGTMGQLPDGAMTLIETVDDARTTPLPGDVPLAYVTQTTLSVDETADIIAELSRRCPDIAAPKKEDICYATTNRQAAVKQLAPACDMLLVFGAPNSSNSRRLVEVGKSSGCADSLLVQTANDVPWERLSPGMTVGVTAGASAPESLIATFLERINQRFAARVEEVRTAEENVHFKLPRVLVAEDA